jgi:hypothetical protein
MKPINKKAREEIATTLWKHKEEIRWELEGNKLAMQKLIDKQTLLKRKKAEIDSLIRILNQ